VAPAAGAIQVAEEVVDAIVDVIRSLEGGLDAVQAVEGDVVQAVERDVVQAAEGEEIRAGLDAVQAVEGNAIRAADV